MINVLAGNDNGFPLGLAGRVTGVTDNGDGTKDIELEPVSYSDIVSESSSDFMDIPLNADNFIGVIAPSAVHASHNASAKIQGISGHDYYSFRNGAVVVESLKRSYAKVKSGLDDETMDVAGKVSLDIEVEISDMDAGESDEYPDDPPLTGKYVITGALENIKLTNKHDFSCSKGLDSMELRMDSDFSFDVRLEGSGSAELGYYSKAWKDVEEASLEIAGQSLKLLGLGSEDKIGKYPLTGLVWSVPCPSTCPVVAGSTQASLTQAKAFGVIVWVYLNLNGELSVDGTVSLAKMKSADLSIGIEKKPDDDFNIIRSLVPDNSVEGDFLVAPSLDGSVGLSLTGGISTDVDFFLSGVRLANAGIDIVARSDMELIGEIAYGTDNLSSPWNWKGEGCFTSHIGAGAIVHAAANIGIEIDSTWDFLDDSNSWGYEIQIPSEDDLNQPGWHGAWYSSPEFQFCWPDEDSDGVSDSYDNCPNTPTDVSVDGDGCSESQLEIDSDGDGVLDSEDNCLYTPDGEDVDEYGCSESQISIDLATGLIAYYSFNGNANDESDNANHLTAYGDTSYSSGIVDSGVELDGDGDFMATETLSDTWNEWSICLYFKTDGLSESTQHYTLIEREVVGNSNDIELFLRNDNYKLQIENDNGLSLQSALSFDDNVWYFLVATFDGTNKRIYVNSVLDTEQLDSNAMVNLGAPLTIGRHANSSSRNYFRGLIDEVRVFNRALNEAEIQSLFSNNIASSQTVTYPENNHTYESFEAYLTWDSAKLFCEERGGHLATLTDSAENSYVYNNLVAGSGLKFYIGADSLDGTWDWVTGENWSYTNWGYEEPSNSNGVEYYLEIGQKSGSGWNDTSLSSKSFICEYE